MRTNTPRVAAAAAAASLTLAAALGGCALLDKASGVVSRSVARYCAEPKTTRDAVAAELRASTAPNSITISCAADPK